MYSSDFVIQKFIGTNFLNFGNITEIDTENSTVKTNNATAIFSDDENTFEISFNNISSKYVISESSFYMTSVGLFDLGECQIGIGDEVLYDSATPTVIGIGFFDFDKRVFSSTNDVIGSWPSVLVELENGDSVCIIKSGMIALWNSYNFNTGEFKACKTDLSCTPTEAIFKFTQSKGSDNEF